MCPGCFPQEKNILIMISPSQLMFGGPFLSLLPIDYKQDERGRVKDLHQMMEGVILNGKLSIRIFGAVIR